jgi:hypothetical protein
VPIALVERRAAQTCRSTQRLLGPTFANVSMRFLYAYFDALEQSWLHNLAARNLPFTQSDTNDLAVIRFTFLKQI